MLRHELNGVMDSRKGFSFEPDVFRSGELPAYVGALDAPPKAEQIRFAQRLTAELRPGIESLFASIRLDRAVRIEATLRIVGRLMSSSTSTLINIANLEYAGEKIEHHSLVVSALMIAFGRHLGLIRETVRLLGLGGLLHDIGKLILPGRLLQKSSQFSAAELMAMRTHPDLGHQMIAHAANVPKAVLDICRHHHERFDGTGYPHQLAGKDIPDVPASHRSATYMLHSPPQGHINARGLVQRRLAQCLDRKATLILSFWPHSCIS
ncbi:HD-GYP domain-containing protein [Rhizobium lusitanum]|uniref:HDIG domain-containing protein n=1 Tax=Rhizobium lusitanum TaxID=293958 RepID=A0A1C3WDI6_9HYPH|nr:HD domain-containing phosphohydrolase [Rhizobium lusitanum]SCB37898.1 HDIG domain-containing protein [Rhizobium lusitanum]